MSSSIRAFAVIDPIATSRVKSLSFRVFFGLILLCGLIGSGVKSTSSIVAFAIGSFLCTTLSNSTLFIGSGSSGLRRMQRFVLMLRFVLMMIVVLIGVLLSS
jgi:hypothetical protein